jgi:acyl-CoA thioester hydrolase
MSTYHFTYDIPVRYGDLDPQGHLNNARFVTFIEQGRFSYIRALGLWKGESFEDLGLIVADVHVTYLAPVYFNQTVRVGVRVSRLGNKSMDFTYELTDAADGKLLARAETVMVSFDYHTDQSIPIPDTWRQIISDYEGIPMRESHA